jgi:hypothetical protein
LGHQLVELFDGRSFIGLALGPGVLLAVDPGDPGVSILAIERLTGASDL